MHPPMTSVHPFKFLYTTFFFTTLPLRVLGILIYYLPNFTHAQPPRSYRQAVSISFLHIWMKFVAAIEYQASKSLEPGPHSAQFVLIDPAQIDGVHYSGVLVNDTTIKPGPVAGFWYGGRLSPPTAGPQQTTPSLVVLHFHGGGFVVGGARPTDADWGPNMMSKHMRCPVLQPQYRLSNSQEDTCFPAALQDAVTAYTYLLKTLQISPEYIVLSGDSAGGNLVMALLRYLEDQQQEQQQQQHEESRTILPSPLAVLLWSPWLNLDVPGRQMEKHRNRATDYVLGAFADWGVRCYTPAGWSSGHPYISPLGNEFHTKTPIFLQTCTAEILYDSNLLFAKNMKERGCKVELCEIADAPHDAFTGGQVLGYHKEAEDAIKQAAVFVKEASNMPHL